MLTVKQINEASFGKAGFSGYKPEDVDKFIDEVADSYKQLLDERDQAVKHAKESSASVSDLRAKNAELSKKNEELQEKIAILAQKIESYRENEDDIKDAILSAQKLAKTTVQEAKDKSEVMLRDAQDSATRILDGAKEEAARNAREYMIKTEEKKAELEEIKRQVTAFRASLLEMYKKHLEQINHIPSFRIKEEPARTEPESPVKEQAPEPARTEESESRPQEEKAPEEPEQTPSEPETAPVSPEPQAQPQQQAQPQTVKNENDQPAPKHEAPRNPQHQQRHPQGQRPGLNDKTDFTSEVRKAPSVSDALMDNDLTDMGIDANAYYNSIPESLREEKENHYSNLEFGDDVDLNDKKHRK